MRLPILKPVSQPTSTRAEFGGYDGALAFLRLFREVAPHAGLDAGAAGLYASAALLYVLLARFDDRDATQQGSLARLRKLSEVLLHARPKPAVARHDPGAILRELRLAGLMNGPLLCDRTAG